MRIAAGPSSRQPRIVATIPPTISGGRSRSDSASETIPTPISTAAAIAAWRAGLGRGGRPDSASMTGMRAAVRAGHQAAAVGDEDGEQRGQRDQAPRDAEPVDAMVNRGLERRADGHPEGEAGDRAPDSRERASERAVGHQHEANVVGRGADGGEHAELAQPALRDDREARGGDQRGQQQEHGRDGEHRECVRRLAVPAVLGAGEGRSLGQRLDEGVDRVGARVHQDRDVLRRPSGRWGDQRELVAELARVLHDADDLAPNPVERQRQPDPEPQQPRHAVGDGDLAGARREAATAQREQLAAVDSPRILRTEVHRLDAPRDSDRAVSDDIARPELTPCGGERVIELARIAAVEPEQVRGRAELGVIGGTGVVDDRDAADRGGHRDGQQRHHQQLLAPLAAEHAPGPANQRAPRGDAARPRRAQRRPGGERGHRRSPAASSESGPGGVSV